MNHDRYGTDPVRDTAGGPFDDADDAFDDYVTSLFDEGRLLFARRLPVEAGLTAIVGDTEPQPVEPRRVIATKDRRGPRNLAVQALLPVLLNWFSAKVSGIRLDPALYWNPDSERYRPEHLFSVERPTRHNLRSRLTRIGKNTRRLAYTADQIARLSNHPPSKQSLHGASSTLTHLNQSLKSREISREEANQLVRTAHQGFNASARPPGFLFLTISSYTLGLFAVAGIAVALALPAFSFLTSGSVTAMDLIPVALTSCGGMLYARSKSERTVLTRTGVQRSFERLKQDVDQLFEDSDDRSDTTLTS